MQLYKPSDTQHDMDMVEHAERIGVNSLCILPSDEQQDKEKGVEVG